MKAGLRCGTCGAPMLVFLQHDHEAWPASGGLPPAPSSLLFPEEEEEAMEGHGGVEEAGEGSGEAQQMEEDM